jgi:hypothetical protein
MVVVQGGGEVGVGGVGGAGVGVRQIKRTRYAISGTLYSAWVGQGCGCATVAEGRQR